MLISVLLFGVFAVLAYTGLFNLLEARFYNPVITASIAHENMQNAEAASGFFSETQARFSDSLNEEIVRRASLSNSSVSDIFARDILFRHLVESFDGIQWVRFIDSEGGRIHFSTYAPDIQYHDELINSYFNYNEQYLPYEMIAVMDGDAPKYIFDGRSACILFSFPLYDSSDAYRGTALFSVSINALSDRLISEGRLHFGQEITVISNPDGLLFGTSSTGESALPVQIASIWRSEGERTVRLLSSLSHRHLALFSIRTPQGFFVGRLVNEDVFSLSQTMRIILLVTVFITVFLIVFLLFNLRQDPVAVVQNRLKQLQISLVEQFYEIKSEVDWSRWMQDLDLRRNEVIVQLKQGIKFKSPSEKKDIDSLINRSWDELLLVLGGRRTEGIDEEKLQSVLKRVLADLALTPVPQPSGIIDVKSPGKQVIPVKTGRLGLLMKATAMIKALEETKETEELEELEPVEDTAAGESSFGTGHKDNLSEEDIKSLASKIEFSTDSELPPPEEASEEASIKEDLEIVSPFAGMAFDFSDGGRADIIKNQDGVPYISEKTRSTDSETIAPLNPEFKDLVDSVIK